MIGFTDVGGDVPVLHLHGEACGRAHVSPLLEALLLRLRATMADGAAVPVPALSRSPAPP